MAVTGKKIVASSTLLLVAVLALAGYISGFATIDSQYGYYEPVWHPDGRSIFFFDRQSRGIIIGAGWEHFTPPANVYMLEDHIRLINYDPENQHETVLFQLEVAPHLNRWTERYHNRIFGWISTVIEPANNSLEFKISLSIPTQPHSEIWVYKGVSDEGSMTTEDWMLGYPGAMGSSELALVSDEELMLIRNPEAYGAAIVKIRADSSYTVVKSTEEFVPEMVIERDLVERSRREQIKHVRRFVKTSEELKERYVKAGFNETSAMLKANDDMENMGLLPRSPKIVAVRLGSLEQKKLSIDDPVFHIPAEYYTAGLFKDVASAISSPGTEVKTSTGDYLNYYDDDVGPRLKKFRDDDNNTFVVESDGQLYRLSIH